VRPLTVAALFGCILFVGTAGAGAASGATGSAAGDPPTTSEPTTTEPPVTSTPPSTSRPPSTTTPASPPATKPADSPGAADPALAAAARSSFLALTDDQRALLRRFQDTRDRATRARVATLLAGAQSAKLAQQLATAQATFARTEAQVQTATKRLTDLEGEIRDLALTVYQHRDRTSALSSVDTATSVDFARARHYTRAPAALLDRRVADARVARTQLVGARARAAATRDQAAQLATDAAKATDQLRQDLATAEAADRDAIDAVTGALGSDALMVGLVLDPQFGADDISAALAIAQAGQPDPVTLLGLFHTPIPGAPVGSPFGARIDPITGELSFHPGLDIEATTGTPIKAAGAGVVVVAGDCGGYGNCVVIDHGHSVATLYGHQSRVLVEPGTLVTDGQVIGLVGSTGKSTGPHLHFEVRLHGTPVDPLLALTA
jgi:murein DD-endopeptidase MepM/ murein hydrolase activator NlpD